MSTYRPRVFEGKHLEEPRGRRSMPARENPSNFVVHNPRPSDGGWSPRPTQHRKTYTQPVRPSISVAISSPHLTELIHITDSRLLVTTHKDPGLLEKKCFLTRGDMAKLGSMGVATVVASLPLECFPLGAGVRHDSIWYSFSLDGLCHTREVTGKDQKVTIYLSRLIQEDVDPRMVSEWFVDFKETLTDPLTTRFRWLVEKVQTHPQERIRPPLQSGSVIPQTTEPRLNATPRALLESRPEPTKRKPPPKAIQIRKESQAQVIDLTSSPSPTTERRMETIKDVVGTKMDEERSRVKDEPVSAREKVQEKVKEWNRENERERVGDCCSLVQPQKRSDKEQRLSSKDSEIGVAVTQPQQEQQSNAPASPPKDTSTNDKSPHIADPLATASSSAAPQGMTIDSDMDMSLTPCPSLSPPGSPTPPTVIKKRVAPPAWLESNEPSWLREQDPLSRITKTLPPPSSPSRPKRVKTSPNEITPIKRKRKKKDEEVEPPVTRPMTRLATQREQKAKGEPLDWEQAVFRAQMATRKAALDTKIKENTTAMGRNIKDALTPLHLFWAKTHGFKTPCSIRVKKEAVQGK